MHRLLTYRLNISTSFLLEGNCQFIVIFMNDPLFPNFVHYVTLSLVNIPNLIDGKETETVV